MIRTLLATTAVAGLLMTGALTVDATAQTTTTQPATSDSATNPATDDSSSTEPANPPGMKSADEVKAKEMAESDGHLASMLIGASVYNSAGENGKDIGKVSDLIIDKDGKVASVVVGVGGFLGIGSKDVAIDYSQVKWEQRNGSWWIIVPTTADQLKALPDFDPKPYQPAPAADSDTGGTTTGGMAPSTGMGTSGMTAPSSGSGTTDDSATTAPSTDTTKKQ